MQLTLREMTERFRSTFNVKIIAIWLSASFVATLAGPFNTLAMPVAGRALYWLLAIGLAISMTNLIIPMAYERLKIEPRFLRGALGALVFAVIYAALLTFVGKAVFETGGGFPNYPLMLLYVAPIALIVTGIVHLFAKEQEAAASRAHAAPQDPPFFKRMKPTLGRSLIRLSMQDHYVEVVTDKGAQLILMRFADALDELDGVEGWRIHRSHWIAEDAIADVKRDGGKTRLVMTDGAELPVSRTYLPALREAGVLKRFA